MTSDELSAWLVRTLPAVDHRGEVVEEVGPDFVKLRLPVIETYLSHGLPGAGHVILSGPVTMGFAETSMYACVHAVYGPAILATTLSLTVSFLRIARGGDLTSVAHLLRRGKRVAFVEARLYSGPAQEPCAHVTASYAIRALDSP